MYIFSCNLLCVHFWLHIISKSWNFQEKILKSWQRKIMTLCGCVCDPAYALPLCPWGHCWRAGLWTGRQPPGWSRDWGFLSLLAPEAHSEPPTSKNPLCPSEVLARKQTETQTRRREEKQKIVYEFFSTQTLSCKVSLQGQIPVHQTQMWHWHDDTPMVDSQLQFTNQTSKWDYPALHWHKTQEPDPIPALIREMAFGPLMDEVRARGSRDISNYDPW